MGTGDKAKFKCNEATLNLEMKGKCLHLLHVSQLCNWDSFGKAFTDAKVHPMGPKTGQFLYLHVSTLLAGPNHIHSYLVHNFQENSQFQLTL